jgi:hypothetical protein
VDPNNYIRQHYVEMSDGEMARILNLSAKGVKNRRHRMGLMKGSQSTSDSAVSEDLDKVYEALEESGDVSKITLTKYVTQKENSAGEVETTSNTRTTVTIDPNEVPMWNPVCTAPPLKISPVKKTATKRDMKVAVILPDPQIGYRFDPVSGLLDPFHDEHAMNVALQIVQHLNPDKIVNLGDYLDLPQYSKYAQEPLFAHTTQPSIDRGASFLAEQRASAPKAEIALIEGNHDKRLMDYIMRNAMAAFGLKRANSAPEDWPLLSVPYLLRLDEIGVKYIEGYPGGEYYINDHLKCIHGKRTGKRGTIARSVIEDERVSTITGHNHHIEIAYKTIHKRDSLYTPFAAILGCLCRIDGVVPSVHTTLSSNGKPIRYYEDWQQAVGVVYYYDDDPNMHIEAVKIHEGRALFNGKEFISNL